MSAPAPSPPASHPVVLFDGVCNLCNASVTFLIDRDPHSQFRFASLQSEVGQSLTARFRLDQAQVDSVVLIEDGAAWTESEAALRIARRLGWPWRGLGVFRVLPRPLRDAAYRWIARNRYRWFGRQEACRLPTPALRSRFLDDPSPQ